MTENGYKLSVITPIYNGKECLPALFDSLKKQTIGFENIEWLAVDDCSPDGSYDMLCEWAKSCPNIKPLKTEKNSGRPAVPRNVGLDNVSAPYVAFADVDDLVLPNAYLALYTAAEQTGADLVNGKVVFTKVGGSFTKEEEAELVRSNGGVFSYREMSLPLDTWVDPFLNNHWSKLFRTEIIVRHNLREPVGRISEDSMFLYEFLSVCKGLMYIEEPIYNYYIKQDSLYHTADHRQCYASAESIENVLVSIGRMDEEAKQRFAALMTYCNIAEFYIDVLLADKDLTAEQNEDFLFRWKNALVGLSEIGCRFHSAYCRILADDFVKGDDRAALFHFTELKALYAQREQEKQAILSSTTYKLASAIAGVKEKLFSILHK